MIETLPDFDNDASKRDFFMIEVVSITVFTLEYCIRWWAYKDKKAFMLAPLNLIDLIAILPFYVDVIIGAFTSSSNGMMKLLRLFRLARVFRVFKLSKYNSSITLCATAMVESKDTLGLMAFMLTILVIVFSAFIFFFEHGEKQSDGKWFVEDGMCVASYQERQADPNACKLQTQFESIPAAAWWTIVTVMTVGYGDMFPRTNEGKLIAVIAMLCSIVILALPISVIGANFSRAWSDRKETESKFMDGHEVSIVYRNMIMNLSEHNSILEDILSEGSVQMNQLQDHLTAARLEYDHIVKTSGFTSQSRDGAAPAVKISPKLRTLLEQIDEKERNLLDAFERTEMVQNEEFDRGVAEAIMNCREMQRVVAEQQMLSAKIEAREKLIMGKVIGVSQRV